MEAVANEAGVGKPAIYRRFGTKAEVVAAAIAEQLPELSPPDSGDPKKDLEIVAMTGLPDEGTEYLALLGGLMAEFRRHPELLQAFRDSVLLPRRRIAFECVVRGQEAGVVRDDIDPEMAVDLMVGPYYARVFAGLPTSTAWRRRAWRLFWDAVSAEGRTAAGKNGAARRDGARTPSRSA